MRRVINYALCAEGAIVFALFVVLLMAMVLSFLQPSKDWIGMAKLIAGFLMGTIVRLPLPFNQPPKTRITRESVTTAEDTGMIRTTMNSTEIKTGGTDGQ